MKLTIKQLEIEIQELASDLADAEIAAECWSALYMYRVRFQQGRLTEGCLAEIEMLCRCGESGEVCIAAQELLNEVAGITHTRLVCNNGLSYALKNN